MQNPTFSSQPFVPSHADAVLYQRTYFTAVMWAYLLGLGLAFGVSSRVLAVGRILSLSLPPVG